jgi:hypothetical protein
MGMCQIFLETYQIVDCKIIAIKVKGKVSFNTFQMVRFHLSNFLLKSVYILQLVIKNFLLRKLVEKNFQRQSLHIHS